jgi:hypothetical protein
MKYVKMFGLAAVAAAALMAFAGAGTASATVFCSTTAEPCPEAQKWPSGTTFDVSIPAGGSFLWENGGTTLDTCKNVNFRTTITNPGSASTTVLATNKEITWGSCTFATKTAVLGSLEVHKISGSSAGKVTAGEEISWTINTVLWGTCIYAWKAGKEFGELKEGKPATLVVNSTIEKVSGSNVACPATGTLVGEMMVTEPSGTTLSVESS